MNGLGRVLVPHRPPLLTLLGIAIAIAGLGLDAAVHLSAAAHHHETGFSLAEHGAHLVGLTGMVVALAGVVISGAGRGRATTS